MTRLVLGEKVRRECIMGPSTSSSFTAFFFVEGPMSTHLREWPFLEIRLLFICGHLNQIYEPLNQASSLFLLAIIHLHPVSWALLIWSCMWVTLEFCEYLKLMYEKPRNSFARKLLRIRMTYNHNKSSTGVCWVKKDKKETINYVLLLPQPYIVTLHPNLVGFLM